MWDVPFRDHTMWRPLSTKLWLLERQKLQTVFLAQVLRYIHAAWPVASLCWVSALLYTLQTLHLNCKGANLRMYMFVSVWFEGVCVDIKENSLKHLTAVKKTSSIQCTMDERFYFEICCCILCFSSLYIGMPHPVDIQYDMCFYNGVWEQKSIYQS